MKPILLVCNLPEEKQIKVCQLAEGLGVRCRVVTQGDQGRTAGELCGLKGSGKPVSPMLQPFSEELLLMAFFPEALMDQFLAALRAQQTPVALKCALTPTNSGWSLIALMQELKQEHQAMQQLNRRVHPQ